MEKSESKNEQIDKVENQEDSKVSTNEELNADLDSDLEAFSMLLIDCYLSGLQLDDIEKEESDEI